MTLNNNQNIDLTDHISDEEIDKNEAYLLSTEDHPEGNWASVHLYTIETITKFQEMKITHDPFTRSPVLGFFKVEFPSKRRRTTVNL